ncbi:MAG: DUF362 domain-containing protein [Chloroflexi bacterium]|nr:DUF362 domain-containing protein [Chloroflexota bacterium]
MGNDKPASPKSQANVALFRGNGRYENVRQALAAISADVDLSAVRSLLIKPNFVVADRPLASTHADAVRALLDFVRARYSGPLIIGEGSASSDVGRAFDYYGYTALAQEYDADLINLNDDEGVEVTAYRWNLRPQTLHLSKIAVSADFRISIGPPKTHDTVIVTLSLKNMIMGSLLSRLGITENHANARRHDRMSRLLFRLNALAGPYLNRWTLFLGMRTAYYGLLLGSRSDKAAMHQGFGVMNLNLACLAPHVYPHLSVIDGFQGMEGEGPADGQAVDWRIAVASRDWLAADALTSHLMGYDPHEIGYLQYCMAMGMGVGDVARMNILGNVRPEDVRRRFAPHPTYRWQRRWHLRDAFAHLPA